MCEWGGGVSGEMCDVRVGKVVCVELKEFWSILLKLQQPEGIILSMYMYVSRGLLLSTV